MKKLLLFSFALFGVFTATEAQCDSPSSASPLAFCGGSTVELEATATAAVLTYTLIMTDAWGDGWNGNEITISADGTVVLADATITGGTNGTATFDVPEGSLLTATWVTGSFTSEVSFEILDDAVNSVYSGPFGGTIDYIVPADTYTLNWYDAAGGTLLGSGSPYDASAIAASTGSYSFFVTQTGTACTESAAVEVVVNVADVNVDLLVQDVSCIGNTDGTFSIATVSCGSAPFSFSVDGGAFGPAPTDLAAGVYIVIVEDGASLQSSPITVVIGTPATVIPGPPSADSPLSFCGGSASIPLEATASGLPVVFTINMFDSFGDSWNGSSITIFADGVPVLTDATVGAGDFASATFVANEGAVLTATWVTGQWTGEVSFDILDGSGATIHSGGHGDSVDYTIPAGTYPLNWYDAAGGTLLGNGSPFEAVGTSVIPTAVTGSYDFFVTQSNGGCESSPVQVTVDVNDVNVTLLVADETCTDYTNGGFSIDVVECGTAPFSFSVDGGAFGPAPSLTAGTYEIVVQDDLLFESSPMMITINTLETVIPDSPMADSAYYACVGDTSALLNASGDIASTDSLLSTMAGGNGSNGNMFVLHALQTTTISDFAVNMNPGVGDLEVWYRPDNYLTVAGANTNAAGWTQIGIATGVTSSSPAYTNIPVPVNITIPVGEFYSFHVFASNGVAYTNGTGLGNVFASNASLEFIEGHGGNPQFNMTFSPRVFNGLIRYEATQEIGVTWFDAATGGTVLFDGPSFEAVGSSILPNTDTAGEYDFFVASNNNGCYSEEAIEVSLFVSDVNVYLSSVDASCNSGADGSFVIDSVSCGEAPFTFSVDGGAAGAAPTDLSPGVYEVVVFDNLGDSSSVYFLTIGSAGGPSDLVINALADTSVEVSWVANGSETAWTVEYGEPGFTPGAGEEIGSAMFTDTVGFINNLSGNTDYDYYVVADCGTGVNGDWASISFTTDCGFYGVPFTETFEDDSETRICWYNINEVGTDDWTYQTGDGGFGAGNATDAAYEGDLNARFVSSFTPSTSKLASPRLDLTGQDSVALVFAYAQETWAGDQNITKVFTRNGDSEPWVEIASYVVDTPDWTLDTLFIVDTTDQLEIAFEGSNNYGYSNVIDQVQVLPCAVEPGIDGSANVCRAENFVDLNTYITAGETYGYWSFPANESFVSGSTADVQFLPAGTHDFLYVVSTPCTSDTTVASLVIYGPSSAGNDGSDTVCLNEPYNLLTSLSGTIDLGGSWIDPQGNDLGTPNITGGTIPGSFNFSYVTTNGVCDADTSTVLLYVDGDCDYLGLLEADLSFFEMYPNPTNGILNIQATEAEGFFSVEITDLNGRIIETYKNYITGNEIKSVDLTSSETGTYFVKVYNNNVFKTFRVVKN